MKTIFLVLVYRTLQGLKEFIAKKPDQPVDQLPAKENEFSQAQDKGSSKTQDKGTSKTQGKGSSKTGDKVSSSTQDRGSSNAQGKETSKAQDKGSDKKEETGPNASKESGGISFNFFFCFNFQVLKHTNSFYYVTCNLKIS